MSNPTEVAAKKLALWYKENHSTYKQARFNALANLVNTKYNRVSNMFLNCFWRELNKLYD